MQRVTRDPWLDGLPLPGVAFAHNSVVEITEGPHAGEQGWPVVLDLSGQEPVYTVELASGAGDVEVPQSHLRPAT